MAASDKPFREQRTLDIVFAVSNILMLLSVVWMIWQDYAREYKVEQRAFREIEVAVAQQQALNQLPDGTQFENALKLVKETRKFRDDNVEDLKKARAALIALKPKKERTEAAYQDVKAKVDSITSFVDQAREFNDEKLTDRYSKELKDLNEKLAVVQADRDEVLDDIKLEQFKVDDIEGNYTKATVEFKKVNDKLDAQVKLALTKQWTWRDSLRSMWVIDGFASPLKIQQYTINDIPIDYNFKYVTRYDRCTSCHLGIDRASFSRENLIALTKDDPSLAGKLTEAKEFYKKRTARDDDGKSFIDPDEIPKIPNPGDIVPANVKDQLTKSRITEFAAHPRLDLFVGFASKHPVEKFGCSSCHYGQGSGTSFLDASHNPNNSTMRGEWMKERGWEPNHMWDFPMLPNRFIESSCIKCHHEVTDLISSENRVEAPKLLKGYNLVKENGCFGCHEISGWKGANRVGPDLRLEPSPPLEDLLPIERVKAENDPDNRPGTMRKVGPALSRASEKLSEDWMKKWIRSPSSFRPDTKMPHYYGLSTNSKDVLPDDQKKFPDTEITSIAHFLMKTSNDYIKSANTQHAADAKDPQGARQDEVRLIDLLNLPRLDAKQQAEASAIRARMKLRREIKLVDLAPGYKGSSEKGRILFTERGCLSCHTHRGTGSEQGGPANIALFAPAISSEAVFGPNLTDIAAKLVPDVVKHPDQRETARTWLIQWIVDPHVHSPRSRMPVTHLTPHEAADVAAWLVAQSAELFVGPDWRTTEVTPPATDDLKNLAKVYLTRMLSERDMKTFLAGMTTEELADLPKYLKDPTVPTKITPEWRLILNDVADDEKALLVSDVKSDDSLKLYLGKKAVNRLGCYGCHDIPGFETAKSIGVGLNDWGKKPADRLAFEDISNFFNKHYVAVSSPSDLLIQAEITEISEKSVTIGKAYELAKDCKFYEKNEHGKHELKGVNAVFSKVSGKGAPATVIINGADQVTEIVLTSTYEDTQPYEKFYADALLGHNPERLGYLNQKLRDPRSYDFNRIRTWDDRSRMPKFTFSRPRWGLNINMTQLERNRFYQQEAQAREAVSTFILGLVAEQVPVKSINTPKGDRLAEVKGRQILDKYNCAGCHVIRPGVFDFRPSGPQIDQLEEAFVKEKKVLEDSGEIIFPSHRNWIGQLQINPDRWLAFGIQPTFKMAKADPDAEEEPFVVLRLSQALQFTAKDGKVKNIPAGKQVYFRMEDLHPKFAGIQSQLDVERVFGAQSAYGGTFADLMVPWLVKRDPKYKPVENDSYDARAVLPPPLLGEGEKVQADWLYSFLLEPHQIRRTPILRMPKFNMSKEEARILSDYFAAVTRMENPGVTPPGPHEFVPQRDDLDSPYWRKKTEDYLAHLRKTDATDMDGKPVKKDGKAIKAYDQRIAAYTPIWEQMLTDSQADLKAQIKQLDALIEAREAALKTEKDKKADLQNDIDAFKAQQKALNASLKDLSLKTLQKNWEEKEAYVADAYRMLTSPKLCLQCHQVGSFVANEKDKPGPPLDLAHTRLRPEWISAWVDKPTRFVPYTSMTQYFNKDKELYQPLRSGPALDQIHAVRDVLMILPRASAMPINRLHNPHAPADKKLP